MNRVLAAIGAMLSALLLVSACGERESAKPDVHTAPNGARYNDADLRFVNRMIQHNAQALALVDLTVDRPLEERAQTAAETIRTDEVAEIERLAAWLYDWGKPEPPTVRDHDHADSGEPVDMSGIPGVISAEQMQQVEATGASKTYRERWLRAMIFHHGGALDMARGEIVRGHNAAVLKLAGKVERVRKAELHDLQVLLNN